MEKDEQLTALYYHRGSYYTRPKLVVRGISLARLPWGSIDFVGVTFEDCIFWKAHFVQRDLRETVFRRCRFVFPELKGADLRGTSIESSLFVDALAQRARFQGTTFQNTCFSGGNYAESDFREAVLTGSMFVNADLRSCGFRGATWDRDTLLGSGSFLQGATCDPGSLKGVPHVPKLCKEILSLHRKNPARLNMDSWGDMNTEVGTADDRCLAGWAVHLAGDEGRALELLAGSTAAAGALIFLQSTGEVPSFHTTKSAALATLRRIEKGANGTDNATRS